MMIPESVNSLELIRPSGRTQGKIRFKLEIKKRMIHPQNYYSAPQGNRYYSPAPITSPSPPQRDYRDFSPYPLTDHYYSRFYYPPPPPPRSMYDRASNYSLPSVPSAPIDHNPLPPRFPSYAQSPSVPPSAPVDAFPVNEAPQPSGPPSAPVDAFPVNDYNKTQDPPLSSRFSSYGVPSGRPSAPVDYSPYDHRQLQRTMGGLSLEEERSETESEFGAKPSCSYGRDYRREC